MSENTRLRSTNLANDLRIEILTEQFRPNEKLTEQAICDKYNVSRTPVREALKTLETEGLIQMIPNRGSFVVGLSKEDIQDLFILRMHSEMQAIRWAIERRTDEEMEAIEESLDFMRFYTERGDTNRMRSINANFHKRIAAASHNRILIENLSRIQDYIRYSSKVLPYVAEDLDTLLKEHKAVYAGFKSKDPEAGEKAMKTHIENSMRRALD